MHHLGEARRARCSWNHSPVPNRCVQRVFKQELVRVHSFEVPHRFPKFRVRLVRHSLEPSNVSAFKVLRIPSRLFPVNDRYQAVI